MVKYEFDGNIHMTYVSCTEGNVSHSTVFQLCYSAINYPTILGWAWLYQKVKLVAENVLWETDRIK